MLKVLEQEILQVKRLEHIKPLYLFKAWKTKIKFGQSGGDYLQLKQEKELGIRKCYIPAQVGHHDQDRITMTNKQREEQAKRLLNDPMYNEAFDSLGENIFNTWAHTSVNDVESREQCWLSLRLLERLRLHLTSIVETGEMAEKLKEYQI